MNPFGLAVSQLWRNRLSVSALIVLIACAMALGVAISTLERSVRHASARAADRFPILLGAKGSTTQLVLTGVYLQPAALDLMPASTLLKAQSAPGVDMAAPLAFGDYHQGHPVIGTSAQLVNSFGTLARGKGFQRINEAVVGSATPYAIGATLQPQHGTPDENRIEAHEHKGVRFTVTGRLPPTGTPWDSAILVPVEAVWAVHHLHHDDSGAGHDHEEHEEHEEHDETSPLDVNRRIGPPWTAGTAFPLPAIVVKPHSVADAYRLRQSLRSPTDTAVFPAEVLTTLYGTLGDLRTLLTLMVTGVQGMVLLAALLAIIASLAARRQSLAVVRALGAPRRYVLALIWIEVAVIIVLGALAGLGLGLAGASLLAQWLAHGTGLQLPVTLDRTELLHVGAVMLAGLLAGLVPAGLAYRQPVGKGLEN